MELIRFTEEEKTQSACYLKKDLNIGERTVDILGGFYQDYSIAIEIRDSNTNEYLEMITMNAEERFLSNYVFENQVIINHEIVDEINTDYKAVIDELTDIRLNGIKISHIDSFTLTLNLDHFERMVHFLETMKEVTMKKVEGEQSRKLKIN